MKRNKISKIIFIIFLIILITGIGGLLFLPNLYDFFKEDSVTNFAKHSIYYRGAFYICYITCLLIVYELICLFHQVYNSSPFKKEVVKALTICSVLFMFLSIIVVIKAFFIPTLLSFVVALICFLASLSFYVLKEVMISAITYKNEIDYTV